MPKAKPVSFDLQYLLQQWEVANQTIVQHDVEAVFAWSHDCDVSVFDSYFINVPNS